MYPRASPMRMLSGTRPTKMTDAGDGGLEGRSSVACCSVPRFDRSDRLICLERPFFRALEQVSPKAWER
jgi:hypothetical protein